MQLQVPARRHPRTIVSVALLCTFLTLLPAAFSARGAFAAGHDRSTRLSGAKAFVLPPARKCLSSGALTLRWKKPRHVRWIRGLVSVDGSRYTTIRGWKAVVRLHGLPSGTFVLSITGVVRGGQRATASRRFHRCGPHNAKSLVQDAVAVPSSDSPSAPPPAPPAGPESGPSSPGPGRYTVQNAGPYLYGFSFYVSTDGKKLEDVSGTPSLRCTPGGQLSEPFFYIPEITIQPDGSFAATRTEPGVVQGAEATVTFTFSGHFHGPGSDGRGRAAGSLREEVVYTNGAKYVCTSNALPWSAVRDGGTGQVSALPSPGPYNVGNAGAYHFGFTFDVSSDATKLLDVSGNMSGHCSPGGSSFNHPLLIPEIAIDSDGSFSATRSEAGQVSGHAATFTFTFSGHFHGYDSSGRALAAGAMREDLAYSNGATFTCSSNVVPWSARSS